MRSDARQLCASCSALVKQLGIIRAPAPRTARWRITGDDGSVTFLCHPHREALQTPT